jgi:hypothetical protein
MIISAQTRPIDESSYGVVAIGGSAGGVEALIAIDCLRCLAFRFW